MTKSSDGKKARKEEDTQRNNRKNNKTRTGSRHTSREERPRSDEKTHSLRDLFKSTPHGLPMMSLHLLSCCSVLFCRVSSFTSSPLMVLLEDEEERKERKRTERERTERITVCESGLFLLLYLLSYRSIDGFARVENSTE